MLFRASYFGGWWWNRTGVNINVFNALEHSWLYQLQQVENWSTNSVKISYISTFTYHAGIYVDVYFLGAVLWSSDVNDIEEMQLTWKLGLVYTWHVRKVWLRSF